MQRPSYSSSTGQYLEARVKTASQPELQLMLLDGALRFGEQVRKYWNDGEQRIERDRLHARMLDILEELVLSVSTKATEQSKRLEEEYAFIYRTLAASRFEGDLGQFEAAVKLLGYQRETWRMTCDKLRADAGTATVAKSHSTPILSQSLAPPTSGSGFSLRV